MTRTASKLTLSAYKALKYPVTLYPEDEGGFTIEIKDLPGCITQGETMAEAFEMIEDAKALWLEVALGQGQVIPLPSQNTEHSGKFVLRTPKTLHRQLAEAADREEVSLNSYIVTLLSQQVALNSLLVRVEHVQTTLDLLMGHMDAVTMRLPYDTQPLGDLSGYMQVAFEEGLSSPSLIYGFN